MQSDGRAETAEGVTHRGNVMREEYETRSAEVSRMRTARSEPHWTELVQVLPNAPAVAVQDSCCHSAAVHRRTGRPAAAAAADRDTKTAVPVAVTVVELHRHWHLRLRWLPRAIAKKAQWQLSVRVRPPALVPRTCIPACVCGHAAVALVGRDGGTHSLYLLIPWWCY